VTTQARAPGRPKRRPWAARQDWYFAVALALFVGVSVWFSRAISDFFAPAQKTVSIPTLVGQTLGDAVATADRAHIKTAVLRRTPSDRYPKDVVMRQSPPAGSQVREGRQISLVVSTGVQIFAIGLFKKTCLADGIQPLVSLAFGPNAPTFDQAWIGALAYTFQLYFDFSGYSDMAIGISLMFGIFLPLNFNSPYKATSIIDFWRRWHMTLSQFLRDYLYIPLGGNRRGRPSRAGPVPSKGRASYSPDPREHWQRKWSASGRSNAAWRRGRTGVHSLDRHLQAVAREQRAWMGRPGLVRGAAGPQLCTRVRGRNRNVDAQRLRAVHPGRCHDPPDGRRHPQRVGRRHVPRDQSG